MIRVSIEGDPNHPIQADAIAVEDRRWNGWAVPWFTTSEGRKISTATVDANAAGDQSMLTYDKRRDVFVHHYPDDGSTFDCAYVEQDGQRIHQLGDGWVWSEVENDE